MTDVIPPLDFDWDGEALRPLKGRLADRYFVIGERYRMVQELQRSTNSHNHYFASLHESWINLPENLSEQYPTVEHLRKRALIHTGFHDERSIVCASKAEALRVAAFVKPMDEYAAVIVRECAVLVLTAKSQSKKAMGAQVFQDSKNKVLDWVSALLSVERKDLEKARAA